MTSDDVKKMDIKEFRELGYLQELNRQFLHPLGLALEVEIEDDGTEKLGGVWDCREDKEGIQYGLREGSLDRVKKFKAKAYYIAIEKSKKRSIRHKELGFTVEPIPEKVEWYADSVGVSIHCDTCGKRVYSHLRTFEGNIFCDYKCKDLYKIVSYLTDLKAGDMLLTMFHAGDKGVFWEQAEVLSIKYGYIHCYVGGKIKAEMKFNVQDGVHPEGLEKGWIEIPRGENY